MVYKHFRVRVISRVLLLGATLVIFLHLLLQTELYATAAMFCVLILLEIYVLISYVEKTNRDLTRFLNAVRYGDFSQTFTAADSGKSFSELREAFTGVLSELHRIRTQTEEHYQYLQTVVQHIGIGLLAFQHDGEIGLINSAAKRLLQVSGLSNLKTLEALNKNLVDALLALKSGEKALLKINLHGEPVQLAIYATEFRLREQQYTLVSIQNIRSELEEQEMEAWQKLIRVLTHEIMNSITPIASLASTVHGLLQDGTAGRSQPPTAETLDDIRSAVRTIEQRSAGLLHFVDAYRTMTRVPPPRFKIFRVGDLFAHIQQLMRAQITQPSARFSVTVEPASLELTADLELVEQVLINLLLNAAYAVQDQPDPQINLSAKLDARGKVVIQVWDNGPGIAEEALEKIFIPFYTTKEEGTGIGLSLSKEIMRLHHGTIQAHSKPAEGTTFSLSF